MALKQSSEALRRPHHALWVIFPMIAVASLILGYIGFKQLLTGAPGSPDYGHRIVDLVYYDLQLFVLGADPIQTPGPFPLFLEIARFAAPAVTIYAIVEAGRGLFAVELSRFRARRASGHTIVCGDSGLADALSRRLQNDRIRVIEIRSAVDDVVVPGEPLRIIGDARDPGVLRAAGIEQAETVYACAEGSATNVAIALAATKVGTSRGASLAVYSHIPDAELCAAFQATFLSQTATDGVQLDFFNIDHIAARRLFTEDPPMRVGQRPPRLLVAGTGGFGAAVVVEAARLWQVTDSGRRNHLPVTLVGQAATEAVAGLVQRYPFLSRICEFSVRDVDLLPLLVDGEFNEPPDRVVICYDDEEYALKTAMTAERFWRGSSESIVVRLDGLATFLGEGAGTDENADLDAGASGSGVGARLLGLDSDVLRVFAVVGAASEPALIREDLLERLARVIHDRYLLGRRRRGEWSSGDSSLEPWHRLSPRLRRDNRAQAEDIGRKLAAIDCQIVPRIGLGGENAIREADIEHLARLEHERWCTQHERDGWRFSEQHDPDRKLHPAMRPWASLPEPMRRRNYDPVRELSGVLADAGFRIVRG